ncbi:YlxR family protein [Actinacidiphila bryophytorum]|uniref:YlxR family protein n=1 Tax=Actinacidiphila bryophytorum TaxID=1436133 RepID=UPI002176E44F|nr:YlxR family protein [Actinacidiphila bryophytorum]UWE11885.1 YlxR family protein [Actinacidiphila bryophytorum]
MSGRTLSPACPERTCVGCRQRAAKSELLRVVMSGDACVPDHRGTLPGRGAYLHPALACLDLAVRRRAFGRAFRGPVAPDTADLRRFVEQQATP